jgi:flagellar assembly factor FliW
MPTVPPANVTLEFPDGLIGCPDWRRFVLRQSPELAPVVLLESQDVPSLSFILADPRAWYQDYRYEASPADLAALEATGESDLNLFAIATVEPEPFSVTLNLLGPLLVNQASGRGLQVIQHQSEYSAAQRVGAQEGA